MKRKDEPKADEAAGKGKKGKDTKKKGKKKWGKFYKCITFHINIILLIYEQ